MAYERKENKEKIKEITEKLQAGIQELHNSDKYREYLVAMSKFHHYSFNNSLLIWAQRPDASAVAGYRGWQTKFGRIVKPGSKGIMIIEPAPWAKTVQEVATDENGNPMKDQDGNDIKKEVERIYQGFKVGYVFAYEDTEGRPLPSIVNHLESDVDGYDELTDVLKSISPVPIYYHEIPSAANGYYDKLNREIHVDSRLSELHKTKTLLHEMAHYYLHDLENGIDIDADRREREVCAESVAFVVCSWLGLDSSDYSFGYVSGWSADSDSMPEFQEKMEFIRKTASKIIREIENEIARTRFIEEENEEIRLMKKEMDVYVVKSQKPEHSGTHRRRY